VNQNLRQYANSGVNYNEKSFIKLATGHQHSSLSSPIIDDEKSFITLALKKPEVAEPEQQETEDIDDENNNPGTDFNASN
jgi:hypothetical protein